MKRIGKLYLNNFDTLLKACENITTALEDSYLSLATLKELIESAKFKNPKPEDKTLNEIEKSHHQILNTLYSTCAKLAMKNHSNAVHIQIVRQCIDTIKKNFKLGLKQ